MRVFRALTCVPQPGGQDNQLVLPDHATWIETNYLLQTDEAEPAFITVKTNGWRRGPPEVMRRLADPAQADSVKPDEYFFRLYVWMSTGDERYAFVNESMWIASAARFGAEGRRVPGVEHARRRAG